MSRTRGALSKKEKGTNKKGKEGEKRSRRFWRMLAAREDGRVEESKDPTGEEGRILACIVDGKAKGCKWEREEGSKESRQGGRQASRLRSIKWNI